MSDYSITALKKALVVVFGLLSASFLARYLGPDLRGQYAVIVNTAAILVVLLNFGMSSSYQADRRRRGIGVAKAYVAYSLCFFSALIIFIALALGSFSIADAQVAILILAAFSLLRLQLQSYGLVESIFGAAYTSITASLFELSILLFLFFFLDTSLFIALLALFGKELFLALGNLILLIKTHKDRARLFFSLPPFNSTLYYFFRARKLVFQSLPFFLLSLLIVLNYKMDVLFLSWLGVDHKLVGIFAIGVLIAEYLWVFSDVFKDVQISRTARGGGSADVALANRLAIAVTVAVYFGFLLMGAWFTELFFGLQYKQSFSVAALMLLANLFMVPCKIFGSFFISVGQIRSYIKIMIFAVILNAVLNIFLIPFYGIFGAIIASVISYGCAGILVTVQFSRFGGQGFAEMFLVRFDDLRSFFR